MYITSRTPLRVSFFGGGTDYPEYFARSPGAVIGMAIDRYIRISAIQLADFIQYKYRVSYSRLEMVNSAAEIEHPVVRAALDHYGVSEHLDISITSDLPAGSGLGSSSAFTVGLLNLIHAIKGQDLTRADLARKAVHVERELLQENVGVQDQLHAAHGGMNRFDFYKDRTQITPVQMRTECHDLLTDSLVLVYTGITRHASKVLEEQVSATQERKVDKELSHLLALTDQAVNVLEGSDPETMLNDFGHMLKEGWEVKRKLAASVSNPQIDDLYDAALAAGALGGKLCGAGGGGFLLMVVPPSKRGTFNEASKDHTVVDISIDTHGSIISRSL